MLMIAWTTVATRARCRPTRRRRDSVGLGRVRPNRQPHNIRLPLVG